MDKGKNKLDFSQSVNEKFKIIFEKEAFASLQYNQRRTIYTKMNEYFTPPKSNTRYKQFFLYPERIQENNRDFILNVMLACLIEVLQDSLLEMQITHAKYTELIPKFTQYIQKYEQNI